MLKPDSVKCKNCIFYSNGFCQRYPPQYVNRNTNSNIIHNGGNSTVYESHSPNVEFPYVSSDNFCGEFIPSDNLTAVDWIAWKKGLLDAGQVQK